MCLKSLCWHAEDSLARNRFVGGWSMGLPFVPELRDDTTSVVLVLCGIVQTIRCGYVLMMVSQANSNMTIELDKEEIEEIIESLIFVARLHETRGLINKRLLLLITTLKSRLKNESDDIHDDDGNKQKD